MATNINTILSWFKTGKKPTQKEFWDSWQSFWHKEEKIPITSIESIESILNEKAEKSLLDTKEDKNQKGVAGGFAPLDNFSKVLTSYLNVVNDLVTGGSDAVLTAEQGKILQNQVNTINTSLSTLLVNDLTTGGTTKALTAEQGKQLKIQITAINTLLTSDNVNLDTVQEIVDSIENIQTYLSNILVNDLTTGGVTKSLTAEMGKQLDLLKENVSNKSQDIEADKASATKHGSVKAVYDWTISKFNLWVLSINSIPGISYTIGLTDYKTKNIFTNTNPVAFTVPTNAAVAVPVGARFSYTVQGAGTVTVAGAGITFVQKNLVYTYGDTFIVEKIGTDTWAVYGNSSGIVNKLTLSPIDGDMIDFGNYAQNAFTLKRIFSGGNRYIDFESVSAYGTTSVNKLRFRLKNYTDSAVYDAFTIETTTSDAVSKVTVGGDLIVNRNLSIIGSFSPKKLVLAPVNDDLIDFGTYLENNFSLKRAFSGGNRYIDFESVSTYGMASVNKFRFRLKNYTDSAVYDAFTIETTASDAISKVTVGGDLIINRNLSIIGSFSPKKLVLAPVDANMIDFGTYLENNFSLKRTFSGGNRYIDFESVSTYGMASVNKFRFRLKNYTDSAIYDAFTVETTTTDGAALVKIAGTLKASEYDLSSLGLYEDDAKAAAGGVSVGYGYINSSTGALHRRLT
jgi:hypothetical protein